MKYKDIVSKMTLEQKVSLLSGKNFWETQDIDAFNIPSIFLSDGPHGLRKQAVSADHLGLNESLKATCFPTAVGLASSWNIDLVNKVGYLIGLEAIDQNVNVLLGPGTNIKRNPLCGRNFEYFSEDPYLSGKMASAQIRGIQQKGIAACVKHLAVNNQEHRRMVNNSVIDQRTLEEFYLLPFEMAVKEGKTKALMTSYNRINGVYANENTDILKKIVRMRWNFKGVIITDWGGNNDRVKALEATSDLEMPSTNGETNQDVLKAINDKQLPVNILDDTVDRLIDLATTTDKATKKEVIVDYKKHHEAAVEIAEETIILLKNEDNILPLDKSKNIALIGDFLETPRYQGAGSSMVNPTHLSNLVDALKAHHLNIIGFEKGYHRYGKKSYKLMKKALHLAKQAEVIVLSFGLDELSEMEGIDRKHMDLPVNQRKLINELSKLTIPTVGILSSGSVVKLDSIDSFKGLLHGNLGGQAGVVAMANVLVGKTNPSGKLTETMGMNYKDYPNANNYPGKELTSEYKEGLYVGYRYFDKNTIQPLFPFGFGLSYTSFTYQGLEISSEGVKFSIKNTGTIKGKEVAQLYIGLKKSSVYRPIKELKGFTKIELGPNESKNVFIPFDEYSFRYFNRITNQFATEEGSYSIYIGSSSSDILLEGCIEIKGSTDEMPNDSAELPTYFQGNIKDIHDDEFEKLLCYKIPDSKIEKNAKGQIYVHLNSAVEELLYAKGFAGRLFARGVIFAIWFLKKIKKYKTAMMLEMGVKQQPLRGISRMSGGLISFEQLNGLIIMFNGQFFRGLKQYRQASKEKKRARMVAKNG